LDFLSPSGAPDSLGQLDIYDALEVFGRGATGVVLKARDLKLQRVVAIKVLAPRLAASRKARERFVHEAQATAAVRDDHVVGIHAVNDEGPLPYLVAEYIGGMTLGDRIKKDGRLELRAILRNGHQVARGAWSRFCTPPGGKRETHCQGTRALCVV
jgi:serine/threonine protein kinase